MNRLPSLPARPSAPLASVLVVSVVLAALVVAARAPRPVAAVALGAWRAAAHRARRWWCRSTGQATAEYVLVLLGAASVALALLAWLARSGRIEALLDQVFDKITAQL